MRAQAREYTEPVTLDHVVQLSADHPGFCDPIYRLRRLEVAQVALGFVGGDVPRISYSDTETAVWSTILAELRPLHFKYAFSTYETLWNQLSLSDDAIPQLADINRTLKESTGFRMEPVAGLIDAETFLRHLGDGVFLSTQYIRHPSRPFYTPEPDVVHEIIGHAVTLMDPQVAGISRFIGRAAQAASPIGIQQLERIYWYTLEFGTVYQDGQVAGFGAGLLSSASELQRMLTLEPLEWDLEKMSASNYDPTDFQTSYYAAPSLGELFEQLQRWVEWRF